ncbi:hypothetical protein Q5O24_03350 [Eubacteriaceae bacterium ES3]|nr:hypothetical protein Q5O24_03350 [Eubacteriaceae bacterium ES3]
MKKYISIVLDDQVEATGNDYNKGLRRCKAVDLALLIDDKANEYDDKGYDLFSVTPLIQGQHVVVSNDGGWANSTTEGVILTFKKKD